MRYKLLILDFDGTIADTKKSIFTTVKETLEYLNLQSVNNEEVKKLIGLPLKRTFQEAANLKGKELELAMKEYRLRYDKIALNTVELFSGVLDTIQHLYEEGVMIAVASSKGKNSLRNLLEQLKVAHMMSVIVGEQDVREKKPSPKIVDYILNELDILPTETIVVGDTIYDVQMGASAGCHTCAVSYGNGRIEDIVDINPTYVVNEFHSLIDIFNDNV